MRYPVLALFFAVLGINGCDQTPKRPADLTSDVGAGVQEIHSVAAAAADLSDPQSFADARRGFIAAPSGKVLSEAGEVIWDFDSFAFIQGAAPPTVHPSLWRQSLLNNHIGLFQVSDRIWQLRGFDIANITLIQGEEGWIVVDALTARETATAAMAFARQHLGDRKVTALIFTHSHADHFGGALGVLSAEEAKARNVPVVAPAGFLEEATSENVMVGTAMVRRAAYMYGSRLPRSPHGLVDTGLGKAVAFGRVGMLPPSHLVTEPEQELVLDGVRFVFHNVPGSEAPAEFTFSVPALKAYGGAELMSHTLHNLYTLRGAKVRDALKWSGYIDEAITLFGQDAEVYFGSHHWPVWGKERINSFLKSQRDTYKFIHDQTLRLANAGYTPKEISAELKLPSTLEKNFANRDYYGTVSHNAKAVYQAYFGWYDGNPANLNPLPPAEAGAAYVEAIGGADKVLGIAQQSYDKGQYRWTAELLNHLVFAQPDNQAARELLAKTYDQLGYQAESGPWRDVYLTGAYELRNGPPTKVISLGEIARLLEETPLPLFFASMAASLNGPRADGKQLLINFNFTDLKENHVLQVENAVLHHRIAAPVAGADATVNLTKPLFLKLVTGGAGLKDTLFSDELSIEGSRLSLLEFFQLLDKPQGNFNFNIIEP